MAEALLLMNEPIAIFIAALALALLFFWYFATDQFITKRLVGTILAIGTTSFCLLGIVPFEGWTAMIKGEKRFAEVHQINPGIDIAGGSAFTLEIQPSDDREITPEAVDQAIAVLRARLDEFGGLNPIFAPRGTDQIALQMPGVSEDEREDIRTLLERAAQLNFHLVHPESRTLLPRVRDGEIIPGYRILPFEDRDDDGNVVSTEELLVTSVPNVPGTLVTGASGVNDPMRGAITIIRFNTEGRVKFGEVTAANVGERLAIVLDGVVVSAPVIRDAIRGGSAEISGMGTVSQANQLASQLLNPLQNSLEIIEEQTVSAILGAEAVRQGILAGVSGFALTLLFLAVYYRVAGAIALVGIGVNMVVLMGIMAMFQFTFTLPGIAGLILTIGMAVDSNVLIYERLKEELAKGKSIGTAIDNAYDKAFSAIFDANITTLITASILFWLATDAVRGFAVILIAGILGTLFASLIVTRVCFRWLVDTNLLKRIGIGSQLIKQKFAIIAKGPMAARLSIIVVVVAIGSLVLKGDDRLGIDFKGGDLITFLMPEDSEVSVAEIDRSLREDLGLALSPTVQRLRIPGSSVSEIQIRSERETASSIINHLRESKDEFGARDENGFRIAASTQSIGPTMGVQLMIGSAIALACGLVGILLYLSVRFEFSFALGAVVAVFHDLIITVGLLVLFGRELNAIMVGAILTVIGYSVNDTIVVFDRIREVLKTRAGDIATLVNDAINETLSRTILTSMTTLFTLTFMAVFGGATLRDFSICLIIGIIVGTYSSIFVASNFVLWWSRRTGRSLRQEVLDAEARDAAALAATP